MTTLHRRQPRRPQFWWKRLTVGSVVERDGQLWRLEREGNPFRMFSDKTWTPVRYESAAPAKSPAAVKGTR